MVRTDTITDMTSTLGHGLKNTCFLSPGQLPYLTTRALGTHYFGKHNLEYSALALHGNNCPWYKSSSKQHYEAH